ncbi:Ger(x)C family spore germination protein [Paenibacillus sp. OV219]|uniref:Ger(x)C family spore germination protein n=1 Tax=Paenibacillus sp. OV219 TaxID=1884377 RepID=UPI0008D2A804|nr:Ger(x)C family spore germination protein [Paenibacillus sp. OV219]SEO74944.1 germination protein, Ger(x)C family [Paenibacillus sp. OV219]
MKKGIAALLICLLLTGCWDQIKLKDQLFVDIVGVDYVGDSKKLKVGYVISSLREASQGGGKPFSLYFEEPGDSIYDSVGKTNESMPGVLTVQETRLYLITPRFAKDEPLNYLSSAGQFISNPLYAHLAVYDGDFTELLSRKKIKEQTVPDFMNGLIDNEMKRGDIPTNKLLRYILGGTDFISDYAINRLVPDKEGARLAGTALFRDGKYTGINLNNAQTQLACLMAGVPAKIQVITSQTEGKVYSIRVRSAKNDYRIIHSDKSLREIDISLKMSVKLIEDGPAVKNHTNPMLQEMEKAIAADLTKKAESIIATLQKANCDYFQLGHELAAYHPKLYKGMNWREEYPKLTIKPKIKVTILNTGVLD